jgi:hypothetical protein
VISVDFMCNLHIDDEDRGQIACSYDSVGECSACDSDANKCPEWTSEEVSAVLLTQAKGSAAISAIFLIYCLGAIRFGLVMRKRISMYQIAFV